jgi:outer membrane lipoprotein carrier protein
MNGRLLLPVLALAFAADAVAAPATPAATPATPPAATAAAPAPGVVGKVQAFYERTTDFKATFQQVVRTRSPKRTFTRSGTVWFQRPGRMRWDYSVPDKVHYVSDGEILWSYDVAEGVAYRLPVKDSDLYQALGFLTGTARLADSFDAAEQPPTAAGLVPVVLTPRPPSSSYKSITLFVDPASGETRETEVLDPLGNVSHVRFENPSFGKLPASGFSFTVPDGVRVQDLGPK